MPEPPADGGAPWWLTVVLALVALAGVILSAVLVRRSSREATAITELGARLTRRSAMEANNTSRLAQVESRLTAVELDKWRRREETMRMLRWAGECAASETSDTLAGVGLAALDALGESELLQSEDQLFIDRVLDAILAEAVAEYHDAADDDAVEVVREDPGSE